LAENVLGFQYKSKTYGATRDFNESGEVIGAALSKFTKGMIIANKRSGIEVRQVIF
jgi:hypothetical protein